MKQSNTVIFSLAPGVYSSIIMKKLLSKYLWIVSIPVISFLVLGLYVSETWYYLIPISIFIVLPMFLFFAYFMAVLTPEAAQAVLPHSFVIGENGIEIQKYNVRYKGEEDNSLKNSSKKIYIYNLEDYVAEQVNCQIIGSTEILFTTMEGPYEIIKLKGGLGRFLVIPFDCKQVGNDKC